MTWYITTSSLNLSAWVDLNHLTCLHDNYSIIFLRKYIHIDRVTYYFQIQRDSIIQNCCIIRRRIWEFFNELTPGQYKANYWWDSKQHSKQFLVSLHRHHYSIYSQRLADIMKFYIDKANWLVSCRSRF